MFQRLANRLTFKFLLVISILTGLSMVLFANSVLAQDFKPYTLNQTIKNEQYQIGEEWSRRPYNGILTSTDALNRAIKATARVDLKDEQGTAFYIGKFNGVHIMLTNYHVISNHEQCATGRIYFESMSRYFRCGLIIEKFKDLEATFISIRVHKEEEYLFDNLALQLDFSNEYKPNHKVVIAGHGAHRNPNRRLTFESSQTCVVATTTYNTNFLTVKGKDRFFGAHSFAHGCELSHGDSGSALVSEITGKVIGLNWATATDKPLELLSSLVLFDWIDKKAPTLWNSLSYAAPTHLIYTAIDKSGNATLKEFTKAQFPGF